MSAAKRSANDGWTVIVPVKATSRGKSRIAVADGLRREIAMALAADTVAAAAAATAVSRVLVVAEDPDDATALVGCSGVDALLTTATSLNDAIRDGLARVTGPVAVLPGDLPDATGAELDATLAATTILLAEHPMVVVPDRQGVGTTLLAAASPQNLQPCYGADSARRHQESGAAVLDLPPDSALRRDVDTLADLAAARTGRTAAVVAAAGLLAVGKVG